MGDSPGALTCKNMSDLSDGGNYCDHTDEASTPLCIARAAKLTKKVCDPLGV